ncbi:MAG: complex I subunit 5 family protein [Candidatus Izemoplasmataceae bacterium]
MIQSIPILLIMIPVVSALLIYILKSDKLGLLALFAQLVMIVLAVLYVSHYHGDFTETYFVIGGHDARIGISIVHDAFSVFYLFLALTSWTTVLLYTLTFKKSDHHFLFFLMFLEGIFLGLIQSNDLFNMFVFIELTTIIVTILIAYRKTGEALRAAIYYLLLNTAGILMFLIGIVLIYNTLGTINVIEVTEALATLGETTIVGFAFVLMMGGISVKAALFPVFTWLPKAHGVADSSISALLSGLVVKGGLYLFIRMSQMFEPAGFGLGDIFFTLGAATALIGVVFALSQKNIKQILAYHTISQVGIMMMGLSHAVGSKLFYGGLLHVFNHALFKSLLFLTAGLMIQVYGTKNVKRIRGTFRSMPFVSVMMVIAMLGITGAPFFNGYISKAVLTYGFEATPIKYWALFLVNIGTAASFIKVAQIFFGPKMFTYIKNAQAQYTALTILAAGILLIGLFPDFVFAGLFNVETFGVNPASIGSITTYLMTLSLGFILYWFVVKRDYRLFRVLRDFQLSFQNANLLFVLFIASLGIVFLIL